MIIVLAPVTHARPPDANKPFRSDFLAPRPAVNQRLHYLNSHDGSKDSGPLHAGLFFFQSPFRSISAPLIPAPHVQSCRPSLSIRRSCARCGASAEESAPAHHAAPSRHREEAAPAIGASQMRRHSPDGDMGPGDAL